MGGEARKVATGIFDKFAIGRSILVFPAFESLPRVRFGCRHNLQLSVKCSLAVALANPRELDSFCLSMDWDGSGGATDKTGQGLMRATCSVMLLLSNRRSRLRRLGDITIISAFSSSAVRAI
jgi:hypothetical protein